MPTLVAGTSATVFCPLPGTITVLPGSAGRVSFQSRSVSGGQSAVPREMYAEETIAVAAGDTVTLEAINTDATYTEPAGAYLGTEIVFSGVEDPDPDSKIEPLTSERAATAAGNDALLASILAANTTRAITIVFTRPHVFSAANIARSGVILRGGGKATKITFQPTSSQARWFAWSAISADASQLNEEGQLIGCGMENMHISGVRSIRSSGVLFAYCDNGFMRDVFLERFKGTALQMTHCREFKVSGYTTRFCGYTDLANGANNQPGTLIDSPSASLDASNLNAFANFQPVYSFGPELVLDGAYSNTIDGYLIHSLARADVDFEELFILENPYYNGAASALGWGTDGLPRNEYAAMHVNSTGGAVADVTSARLQDAVAHYNHSVILKTNANGQSSNRNAFGAGRVIGHGSIHTVLVTGASDAQFGRVVAESVGFWAGNVTIDAGTDVATVTSVVSGSCCDGVPLTGTPCRITAAGSPVGLPQTRQFYAIRLTATTMKFATSYANAIAGTAIDLTSTGTTVVVYVGGAVITALGGATIVVDEQSYIDNGRTAMWFDDTSSIRGMPRLGTTFSLGPLARQVSGEQLVFEGRNISLAATGDKALTKRLGGWRASMSRILVFSRGTTNPAAAVLEFWTAAGGTGTAIAASAAITNASADGFVHEITVASTGKNAVALLTMFARCTTAVTDGVVDIFVYGYPAD